MKWMELFHCEYQHEEQQYLQQKEREENEKLKAILQYTRNTFRQFDFSEEEIFQICECVQYFVTNRQALSVNIHIKRRTAVTQISLKNFAWNIAFQYNICRDVTAQFVMQTFHEWFANSTIDTIRKNLRTTTGKENPVTKEFIWNSDAFYYFTELNSGVTEAKVFTVKLFSGKICSANGVIALIFCLLSTISVGENSFCA